MRCQFAFDDAGYVLGALPPDERREFVNHLPTCVECRASVRDLAGLPGLLARVDPSDVEGLGQPPEPAPSTLLPRLLAAAQADQLTARRRRRYSVLAAAACLLVIAALAVPLALENLSPTSRPPAVATSVAMQSVAGNVPVRAAVGLADSQWGTNVTLRCSYAQRDYTDEGKQSYALYAVPRTGQSEQIGSWSVGPGDEVVMSALTRFHRADLAALELRRTDGKTILRTNL